MQPRLQNVARIPLIQTYYINFAWVTSGCLHYSIEFCPDTYVCHLITTMRTSILVKLALVSLTFPTFAAMNTLTDAEKAAGWQLLWDGKTSEGWRSAKSDNFPSHGWSMKDGVLTVHDNNGEESAGGGDIITKKRYANFELLADFKLTPGANSGIKIFVQPSISPIDKKTGKKTAVGSAIGMEFQVLDDERHPDAKLGKDGDRTIGSLYDLIPAPADKKVLPIGEWNHARILSRGKNVE